jgi:hypothetical protein
MLFICCLFGFELRNWNFVVTKNVEDPRNEVAFAKPIALATLVALVENARAAMCIRPKGIRCFATFVLAH